MDAISNRSLKARVGALAVSLVMATAIATPALAFADGTTSQSTEVTIQSVTPARAPTAICPSRYRRGFPLSPRQTARCWPPLRIP